MKSLSLALVAFAAATAASNAQIEVTEYMHKGLFGEYIEIANLGSTGVDITGYRYNDSGGGFGGGIALPSVTLGQDETVIVCEVSSAIFELAWYTESGEGTPLSLKGITANSTENLGGSDTINIYDAGGNPVDSVVINNGTLDTEDRAAVFNGTSWVFANTTGAGNFWKAGLPGANGPTGSPGVVLP